MRTKDLILETALKLFNKNGYNNVSTYNIAEETDISQGNLTYHFPTKKDLANALAKNMIDEIDLLILSVDPDFALTKLYKNFAYTFRVNLKYHFFYMNYSQIVLNDENLNNYFLQNDANRKVLLKKMLTALESNGYLKKDTIIHLNDQLAETINLMAIYWVPQSAIYHKSKTQNELIHHHLNLIFLLFKPYLTKKGQQNLTAISSLPINHTPPILITEN